MEINIKVIPHKEQRYDTCGDWFWERIGENDILNIRVSELGDWREEMAIGIHEAVEALLCKNEDISQERCDYFDMKFEAGRKSGNVDEPGDEPDAPYHLQHGFATAVERLLLAALRLNWKQYEKRVYEISV